MSAAVVVVRGRPRGPDVVVDLRDAVVAGGRAVAQCPPPHADDDGAVAGQLMGEDGREVAALSLRKLAEQPLVPRSERGRALGT